MKPLSKSQFKLGLECLQKLRHYRDGLPSKLADNDLLRLLAEGGGAVEALQRAVEKPAWLGAKGGAAAASESLEKIRAHAADVARLGGGRSLYEVTFTHGDFLARIDLLRVRRDRLELVEIKAKSITAADEILTKDEGSVRSAWVPYVQDLAFQCELLRRWLRTEGAALGLHPHLPVVPRLLLVKSGGKATDADKLGCFRTHFETYRGRTQAEVTYEGPGAAVTDLLVEVDAALAVNLLRANARATDTTFDGDGIAAAMDRMVDIVRHSHWPATAASLGSQCKRCEYRSEIPDQSGLVRCWGADVDAVPHHILKLAYLKDDQVNEALALNAPATATLTSLPEASLQDRQKSQWLAAQGTVPPTAPAAAGDPFVAMKAPEHGPVYFLDFETAMYPIPSRAGGSPYELVPFQFEGHRLPARDAALTERVLLPGFLDLASDDPRRAMVRALAKQFGDSGPIYHWSPYERTVIKAVAEALRADPIPHRGDADLALTCDRLLARLIDLCAIARQNIVLPATNGSYSIKKVLPVIWADPELRRAFSSGRAPSDPNAYADRIDPYKSLPNLEGGFLQSIGGVEIAEPDDDEGAIRNGGLAMLYYHYVRLFGGHDRPEIQRQFRQYCQLDSAAMVMAYDFLRRGGIPSVAV